MFDFKKYSDGFPFHIRRICILGIILPGSGLEPWTILQRMLLTNTQLTDCSYEPSSPWCAIH